MEVINSYIYLYHLDEFLILPSYPETIVDQMATTFGATNALSRSAPIFSYSHSGPRTVQIALDLHRDMIDAVNVGHSNFSLDNLGDDYVDSLIRKLQSIALPKYNTGAKAVTPPKVAVRFGDEIFIKGVVTSGINVTYKKPIIIVNGNESKYAQVSIAFTVSEDDPYDADTVATRGSFRGLTRTNNLFERGE